MDRKREIAIFIAIILFCGFWRFSGAQQKYITPEKALLACEKGLHYGPTEKILLKYKGEDRHTLVIGKVDERNLSAVSVKRTWNGMYKLASGGITGQVSMDYDTDRIVTGYSQIYGLIYGLTDIENADTISCVIIYKNNHMDDFERTEEFVMTVDEDGFFYTEFPRVDEESWYYTVEEKAYDKDGNLIFDQKR